MRAGAKFLSTVAGIAAWLLAPGLAFGAADISGTDHDFTTAGPNASFKGAGSECETCHIPHHTGSAQLLWNHTLSGNTLTFGTSATTVAGTTLPTDVGSAPGTSKFCLSCHDGSVAVGSLIHGTSWGTTKITGDAVIAPSGSLVGNHPVEVPYPDQSSATYNSITTAADPSGYQTSPTGVKLFGTTAGQKGIGCASCHDPHDATNDPFLRVAEASLCSSCHIK
ncbi:MAG: cytochrome c3 family protein [Candidatus Binatia bacterium]